MGNKKKSRPRWREDETVWVKHPKTNRWTVANVEEAAYPGDSYCFVTWCFQDHHGYHVSMYGVPRRDWGKRLLPFSRRPAVVA